MSKPQRELLQTVTVREPVAYARQQRFIWEPAPLPPTEMLTMRLLHDAGVRSEIEGRIGALHPTSTRQWGSMTPDQMLWHLNQFLAYSLGEATPTKPSKAPLPLPILRFFTLYMPWPKGAPTNPNAKAEARHDFATEQAKCLALIDRFASRPLQAPWPIDPTWGKVTGKFQSQLHAKHLDHHLRQFSV